MDCVHCGWLTKSPPESRMKGPFKSQWRRRFFVLYAPPRASAAFVPSGRNAFLHYYDSEKITKKKGSIDLENCEELRDRLNSSLGHRYLFSLRTCDHGNIRTYYLAADTEAEMDVWVDKLAMLLDLGNDVTQTPVLMSLNSVHPVLTVGMSSETSVPLSSNTSTQKKTYFGNMSNNIHYSTSQSPLPLPPTHTHVNPLSRMTVVRSHTCKENSTLVSPYAGVLPVERPVLATKPHIIVHDIAASESEEEEEDDYVFPKSDLCHSSRADYLQTVVELADDKEVYNLPRQDLHFANDVELMSPNDRVSVEQRPVLAPKLRNRVHDNAFSKSDGEDEEYIWPKQEFDHCAPTDDGQNNETYDVLSGFTQHPDASHDDTYDLPPRMHTVKSDAVYDVPSMLVTSTNHGSNVSHHGYINLPRHASLAATRSEFSNMKHLSTDSNMTADSDDYKVMSTSRTRSYKSTKRRTHAAQHSTDAIPPSKLHLYSVHTDQTEHQDEF